MPYLYHTDQDRKDMLDRLGLNTEDELFEQIPARFHINELLPIGRGKTEQETRRMFEDLSVRNRPASCWISFLGGGIYDHVIPSVVGHLIGRPEFATAYTPYQPEVSQGTLQLIFEFQTHISRLTGMDVANASMYDASTALAEATLMAAKIKRRDKILYPEGLNPRYLAVVKRYAVGQNVNLVEIKQNPDTGDLDDGCLGDALDENVAGLIVQTPNYFGVLEKPWEFEAAVHENGSLLIAAVDPISLSILRPPGDWGADIVIGEGQSLGNAMSFGGPLVGFMACRNKFIRQMPGRIVSTTKDIDGRDAYVLTLQTREQHIRREKATSNICTNQGLLAARATVYLSVLGETGLTELGRLCYRRAHDLADKIRSIEGCSLPFDGPFFREFVVKTRGKNDDVLAAAREKGVLAGIPLDRYFGKNYENQLLIAVTEKHTEEDLDALCDVLKDI